MINGYDQAVLSQPGKHDVGHINGVNGHIFIYVTEPLGQKHKHFYKNIFIKNVPKN